ncbi:LamG-like jellyroll fold domain-containing protein, partial [Reichenbachiella sp.]
EFTASNFTGHVNGMFEASGVVSNGDGLANMVIGAISSNGGGSEFWDGNIAEMVMYSGTLTAIDRQKVESYLAIKYGINLSNDNDGNITTLESPNGNGIHEGDYVSSDGAVVWDASVNTAYANDIIGIGRDDASQLNQKQSKSINGSADLAIGRGGIAAANAANANTFANDDVYFVVGDNGGDLAFLARNIADIPTGVVDGRTSKVWFAEENKGDVGGLTLEFDMSGEGYPAAMTAANFVLLVDSDGTFSDAANLAAASYAGDVLTFNNVNISDGEYFAIGIINPNFALDFDGTNHVDVSSIPLVSGNADHTFETWVKIDAAQTGHRWIAWWGANVADQTVIVGYDADNANQIRIHHLSGSDILTSTTLPMGTWTHLAVSYTGSTRAARIFLNGVFQEEVIFATNLNLPTLHSLQFGLFNSSTASAIDGQIDESRFWSVARADSQIGAFYDDELDGTEPGLIAYYNYQEGGGSTVFNQAGAVNGSYTGGAGWVTDAPTVNDANLDTTVPNVTITSTESGTTAVSPIPVTITFNEEVAHFDVVDITVGNGSVGNLNTADNITFTADITPHTGGAVTVDVNAAVATDLTGNSNTAASQFSINYAAPENALSFDGTDDYVDLTTHLAQLDFDAPATIEFWYRSSQDYTSVSEEIFALGATGGTSEFLIRYGTFGGGLVNPVITVAHWNSSSTLTASAFTSANTSAYINSWHHYAVVATGTTYEIYVDGVQVSTSYASTGSNANDGDFGDGIAPTVAQIGARGNFQAGSFAKGELDNFRLWNVARSASDILGNMTTNISSEAGLVAAYDFNSPSGTSLYDIAGSNHGTLQGAPPAAWVNSTVTSCAPNGKFIGSTDSDWNDPTNWCGGVVPMPSNVNEDIVVSVNSDVSDNEDLVLNGNSFQILAGATLTLDLSNNALDLQGGATFTNNGTVFFASGTELTDAAGNFVNNGTITGFFTCNNDFTNPLGGTVAPGASPGCVTFASNFTNAGTLDIEVDGTVPCTGYDQITVTGTANLGGTLNVTIGYTPVSGDQITIITAGSVAGTFSSDNLPANWTLNYTA